MPRRIFIGDIQGCRPELERLLERVRYDPATDTLEPVGDLVNRGPDSLGVLRLLRSLGAQGVLGNHDLHLLRVAAGQRELRADDTLDAVLAAPEREELLAWLAARPLLRVWPDLWCVHAGLNPAWSDPERELTGLDPLRADERSDFATRVRTCTSEGRRPEADELRARAPFAPWYEHYRAERHGGRTLVFGHWALLGLLLRPKLRGLDTGCVWGGSLTAWIAEEDRIVQVRAERVWARPERARGTG